MIRLHLGAHKTATTYLQELFTLNRGAIAEAGRAYWPLAQLRPLMNFAIWTQGAGHSLSGRLRLKALQGAPYQNFGAILAAHDSPIVSDENILGSPRGSLRGQLYPRADARLGGLARIFGERPVEVWLCLRSYPQFLASLYAEALRDGAFMPVAELLAANGQPEGQWPSLVEAVHRALPRSRIVVWRYEDFQSLQPVIVERLSGVPLATMKPLSVDRVRPGPSAAAIVAHLERAETMTRPQRVLSMVEAEHAFPSGDNADRFDPWPEEQAARMAAAYDRDVALVGAKPFVELLRP